MFLIANFMTAVPSALHKGCEDLPVDIDSSRANFLFRDLNAYHSFILLIKSDKMLGVDILTKLIFLCSQAHVIEV